MQEKGATSQFYLTIMKMGTMECKESIPFEIDNKAKICFQISHNNNNENEILLMIALQKIDVSINTAYKINVICKDLNYSKDHAGPEFWSDWNVIGELRFNQCPGLNGNLYLSQAKVCVRVYTYTVTTAGLVKFFEDSDLTDFHLSTGEGSVAVHRAYLAARSDFFKAMLSSKWKETDEGIIEIKHLTLQTLKHFKEYLYLGSLPDGDNLRPLLVLASQYCVEDLKAECITKLALTVLPENVYSLLDFACDFKLPELSYAVTQLTPDDVIHQSYAPKKTLADTGKAVV